MKAIKFNNKDFSIPTCWEEVTVGMLIKASELDELLPEAPIISVISAYTGIPVKDLKLSNANVVQEILSDMAFMTTPYKAKPKTSFTLDGNVYACEDDLTNQKFEDFVSIETALYNYRDEPHRALPRLLAIYCKKAGETLDDFKLDERAGLMYRVSMTDAKDIEAFFLTSVSAYKAISLLSSTQDIQKDLVLHKVKELSGIMKTYKGRNGISFGTKLRIGYYQIVLYWVKKRLELYFNSPHTNNSKKNWLQTFKNWLTRKVKRNTNGNSKRKL